jgi:hypothetical protein
MGCAALGAAAQDSAGGSSGVGWIGLYSTELVEWLDNENRLDRLCSPHVADSAAWNACRQRYLLPKVFVVRLRTGPAKNASAAGDLMLEAVPSQGLRAFYVPPDAGAAVPLTPDILDTDWGYGPFFDHSIVERRGSWVRLPEGPLPPEAWLDVGDLGADRTVIWLEPGDIVESPRGDLYVLEVVNDRVRARPEQERDMWCHGEPQPPLAPFREFWLDRSDVYTSTGHIRLRPKYTRGC